MVLFTVIRGLPVFSSLVWVLFAVGFVCFLVGGLYLLFVLCDCNLGVGFGTVIGFVCLLVAM